MATEQLELMLKFENELNVIAKLTRCKEPLISKVELDASTDKINKYFDFDFDGTNKFYPFEFHQILKELDDFSILCIVGASGAGKSTFAKYYGQDERLEWDPNKCILSNIDMSTPASFYMGYLCLFCDLSSFLYPRFWLIQKQRGNF